MPHEGRLINTDDLRALQTMAKGQALHLWCKLGIGTKHGKPKCSAHRSRSRGLTASSQHPSIGKRDRKQRLETSMHCNLLYSPHIHEKH
jgi:hypothetical protein